MLTKFKEVSFFWKMTFPILIILPLAITLLMFFVKKTANESTVNGTILTAMDIVDQYKTIRGYYTKHIVKKVKSSKVDLKFNYDHIGVKNTLPLPATLIHNLSKKFSEKEDGIKLKLYSDLPFPNRKNRKLDRFQKDAIAFLKVNPSKVFKRNYNEYGQEHVRVAIADTLVAQGCVNCHNNHPETPFNKWKVGDVRGILEVEAPINSQVTATNKMISTLIWISIVFTFVFIFLLILFLSNLSKGMIKITNSLGVNASDALKGSEEVAGLANKMKDQISTQSEAITEAVASLDEISSMVSKTSQNAVETKELSLESAKNVSEGQVAIKNMVISMEDINESNSRILSEVEVNNNKFKEIVDIINEISEKTNVINDIVFQTKLLSFNASVEAARAGEHGKGFAVVAEEVGNLATMSGSSAAEITEILERSKKTVEAIVNKSKDSVEQVISGARVSVEAGIDNTQTCERVFGLLVGDVSAVEEKMSELTAATHEQSLGVQEISKTMNELSSTSQAFSFQAKELKDFSISMKDRSTALKTTVGSLEKIVLGKASAENTIAETLKSERQPGFEKAEKSKEMKVIKEDNQELPKDDDPRFEDL